MRDLVLLKLGGSLITDKRRPNTLRHARLRRLAGEVAAVRRRGALLLLGHGGGSFGHAEALKHGLNRGPLPPARRAGIARTQERAATLHRLVVRALLDAGVAPFSLVPSSLMVAAAGRPRRVQHAALRRTLERGLLPVTHGDVVLDETWGASVCSTETVLLAFARRLLRDGYRIPRVVWLGETDGVWNAGGRPVAEVDAAGLRRLRRSAGGAAGADVTGGMAHRLEAAAAFARLGTESWIVDGRVRGRLGRAVLGRPLRGTRIHAVPRGR